MGVMRGLAHSQLAAPTTTMDLLGGYGSDESGDDEPQGQPSPARPAAPSRPQPSSSAGPSSSGALDAELFSKLPSPSVTERAAKRVISFQLPLNRQMIQAPDSDDDAAEAAERRAKRLKAANKTKSKLMDYLPPPKAVPLGGGLGGGAPLGGGGAKGRRGGGFGDDDDDEDDPVIAAGRGDGGAAAVGLTSNEVFRAADAEEGEPAEQYAAEQYEGQFYSTAGPGPSSAGADWQRTSAQYQAGPSSAAPPPACKAQVAGGFELPPELANVEFKEINGKDLRQTGPPRPDATSGMLSALGSEFANQLRSQAKNHAGTKMARSKHQIGTLFYNAKMNEIDLLEGKANSMKTKAETQAKYGWR